MAAYLKAVHSFLDESSERSAALIASDGEQCAAYESNVQAFVFMPLLEQMCAHCTGGVG